MPDSFECKVCGEKSKDRKSLHSHVKKAHSLRVGEYYVKSYARKNLATGELLPYKDVDSYFSKDFGSKIEMRVWLKSADKETVKQWMIENLSRRAKKTESTFAPCEVELDTLMMPSILDYERVFGTYVELCSICGLKPKYKAKKDIKSIPKPQAEILVDTREQKPLSFPRSKIMKLAFADYSLGGEDHTYTYVDRKSGSDFNGTFGKDKDRFERELNRAILTESFIYVVIEETVESSKKTSKKFGNSSATEYPFKNMRDLLEKYHKNIQFIFTGNRKTSENIIPYLLAHGKDLWDYDVQLKLKRSNLI